MYKKPRVTYLHHTHCTLSRSLPDGFFGVFDPLGHEDGDVVVVIDHESPDVDVVPLTHGKRIMRDPMNDFRPGIGVPIDHVQFHHQLVPRLPIIQIHCQGRKKEGGRGEEGRGRRGRKRGEEGGGRRGRKRGRKEKERKEGKGEGVGKQTIDKGR